MNKKKYNLIRFYSGLNFGDDLFLRILCERYPNEKFCVFLPRKKYGMFSIPNNLKVIDDRSLLFRLFGFIGKKLHRKNLCECIVYLNCKRTIIIGGSIFIQKGIDCNDKLDKIYSYPIEGKPYYVLGMNFGPYDDLFFLNGVKQFFVSAKDVCTREKYTYELLGDTVRYASDIAFLNPLSKTHDAGVVISVVGIQKKKELKELYEFYRDTLIKLVEYYESKREKITFVAFCEQEGDFEILNDLSERCKVTTNNVYYNGDTHIIEELFANASVVITGRFHSMILALKYRIPFVPLTYSDKMTNILSDLGCDKGISISQLHNYDTDSIIGSLVHIENNILDDYISKAEDQFLILDKDFING